MEAQMIDIDNTKVMQLPDILHSFRVAYLTSALCDVMQFNQKLKSEIFISAVLHDIGKSMIDKEVLNKNGNLTSLEWNSIKFHAEIGGMIASNMGQDPTIIKNIVYHHENYDGSGYPRRLKGNWISIGAQIIRICDTYDALRMKRPYKRAFSHSEAIEEMIGEKEKYNPIFLKAFIEQDFNKVKGFRIHELLYE